MLLIPTLGMSMIEEAEMESIEDLGWHDLERITNWEISNAVTKREILELINHISKKDMIVKK